VISNDQTRRKASPKTTLNASRWRFKYRDIMCFTTIFENMRHSLPFSLLSCALVSVWQVNNFSLFEKTPFLTALPPDVRRLCLAVTCST
jgi:hypothetical protein